MKPRLMVAPLTGEDCIAWRMVRTRWIRRTGGTGAGLRLDSAQSDRSDAGLMFNLALERAEYFNEPVERCAGPRWWDL